MDRIIWFPETDHLKKNHQTKDDLDVCCFFFFAALVFRNLTPRCQLFLVSAKYLQEVDGGTVLDAEDATSEVKVEIEGVAIVVVVVDVD